LLRITQRVELDSTTLKLEGSLRSPWLEVLRDAVAQAPSPAHLRLDLTGLRHADPGGIELLRALAAAGAMLSGANPYLQDLLQGSAP
jgi:ABC-type transporter Mla MlaB component